jgi:hypothetical protein
MKHQPNSVNDFIIRAATDTVLEPYRSAEAFFAEVNRRVDLPYADPAHLDAGLAYWLIRDRIERYGQSR